MFDLLYFGNSHFIRDAVVLNDADGISEQSVSVLCHRFRYRYCIASAVGVERTINVHRIVLDIAQIDGVLVDLFRYLHLHVPRCAT